MSGRMIAVVIAALAVVAGAAFYLWPTMQASAPAPEAPQGTSAPAGPQLLFGIWSSQTDAKFTREIRADGAIIDHYEGDTTLDADGRWSIVNPALEGDLADRADALADLTIVKASWENDSYTTYFAINALSESEMTSTDLSGNGEVTNFVRM